MMINKDTYYFYITTNKTSYYPGDTVNGCVHLKLFQEYPIKILQLKISGKEESHWDDPNLLTKLRASVNPNDSTVKTVDYHSGKTIFYCHKYTLRKWKTSPIPIQKHLKFPFSFKLHNYIPASFLYSVDGYHAKVSYKLTGLMESWVEPTTKAWSGIKTKIELIIKERSLKHYLGIGEFAIQVFQFKCINKGNFTINLFYDDKEYRTGEKLSLSCEVDNTHSTSTIQSIRVTLWRQIILKSDQGGINQREEEIITSDFPCVKARKSALGSKKFTNDIFLTSLNREYNEYEVLLPTTTGRFVVCCYYFKVKPILKGCCLSMIAPPDIRMPLIINPSEKENYNMETSEENIEETSVQELLINEMYSYDKSHIPKKMDLSSKSSSRTNSSNTIGFDTQSPLNLA